MTTSLSRDPASTAVKREHTLNKMRVFDNYYLMQRYEITSLPASSCIMADIYFVSELMIPSFGSLAKQ